MKETINNYGKIVIYVLVLSIIISLATPFANAIKDSFISSVNSLSNKLNEVNEKLNGLTYVMLEGDNQYCKIGETNTLTFRSEAPYDEFCSVKIDGVNLPKNDYTVSEGSTVVTLTSNCVNKLADGEHEIEILFMYGSSKTKFTTTFINALNLETLSVGYVEPNGVVNSAATSFVYTEKVPVTEGDIFSGWLFGSTASQYSIRFVTAYDENGNVVENGGFNSGFEYTVPAGVASVFFST